MLKIHIRVGPESDLETEIAKVDKIARDRRLPEHKIDSLIHNATSLLKELKTSAIGAKSAGFNLDIKKTLKDRDYLVTFEVAQTKSTTSNSLNVFSRLFGK